MKTKNPKKQRKMRYNAPGHLRHKMMSAHLDKLLSKKLGKRSMKIRKGDEVEIMRGAFRKKRGIISVINRKNMKILIENIKIKKGSGQENSIDVCRFRHSLRRTSISGRACC